MEDKQLRNAGFNSGHPNGSFSVSINTIQKSSQSEAMGCLQTQQGRNTAICLACTGLLAFIILLTLSFSYIEYYEYGLAMR